MDMRASFETFLNDAIETEFEQFIGAKLYDRSNNRSITNTGDKIYRNGYRTRKLNTSLGTITLRIPRTNKVSFMPSFIERYKRNTDELNNLIQQMYVNGVSTAKINRCTKVLGVSNVSKSQVSRITDAVYNAVQPKQELNQTKYEALYIDATFEKVRINNRAKLCAMISVLGYTNKGTEFISTYQMPDESYSSYIYVLNDLKRKGLIPPKLIISDYAAGLINAMQRVFPDTLHQRCKVHFIRNIFRRLSNRAKRKLSPQIKRIYYTNDPNIAIQRANALYNKYKSKYPKAMDCLMNGIESTLTYMHFNNDYLNHRRVSTSNPIERINREFKRRTKSMGVFPSIKACNKIYTLLIH